MRTHFYRLGRLLLSRGDARRVRDEPEWYVPPVEETRAEGWESAPGPSAEDNGGPPFEVVEPADVERYKTVIPLMSLKAAAGGFGESMEVEPEAWVKPRTSRRLGSGMFVAQVVGRSMEPRIPDGAHCIFRSPVAGSRTGKILLVQHSDIHDPESGGSYTVKEFDSSGVQGKDGGSRTGTILLKPLNPEFQPIELSETGASEIRVVAELVEVLT